MISYLGGVGRRNGRRRRKKEEISEYDLMVWHGMKSSRHAFMYSFCNRLSPSTLSGRRRTRRRRGNEDEEVNLEEEK